MSKAGPQIILFTYPESPWGNKVAAYLHLRGIKFTSCEQPRTMPRDDLEKRLGIKYRRIPIMAVGRDFYFDTRLMIDKLEELFPDNTLGATGITNCAMEKMLRDWAELAVFSSAVSALPPDMPAFKNDVWMKDRAELAGRRFSAEDQAKRRPGALVEMRTHFELLEELLADGRKWLLDTETVQVADLHAAFAIDWLLGMPNGLPEEFFGAQKFPNTTAFMQRYREAVRNARRSNSVASLSGQEAATAILKSEYAEETTGVRNDPVNLKQGQNVKVARIDDASSSVRHFDTGSLVALNSQEVVISRPAAIGDTEIRLHYPRWKFNVSVLRESHLS